MACFVTASAKYDAADAFLCWLFLLFLSRAALKSSPFKRFVENSVCIFRNLRSQRLQIVLRFMDLCIVFLLLVYFLRASLNIFSFVKIYQSNKLLHAFVCLQEMLSLCILS